MLRKKSSRAERPSMSVRAFRRRCRWRRGCCGSAATWRRTSPPHPTPLGGNRMREERCAAVSWVVTGINMNQCSIGPDTFCGTHMVVGFFLASWQCLGTPSASPLSARGPGEARLPDGAAQDAHGRGGRGSHGRGGAGLRHSAYVSELVDAFLACCGGCGFKGVTNVPNL